MRTARLALAVSVLVLATACSDDGPSAEPSTESPTTTTGSPTAVPSPTPTQGEPSSPPPTQGGDLRWRPVPGSTEDTSTVSGRWTITLTRDGSTVQLDGPEPHTFRAPDGFRFTDALIDGQFAVAVAEHRLAERPNEATVLDLASGRTSTIDGSSQVPTTVGGPWALGSGILVHATTRGRSYCLGSVDLLAGREDLGPCVPPRHGISNVTVSASGIAAMTFDAGRPSCRTVNRVEGGEFTPVQGPAKCKAWDVVATETGAVWSVVPDERRVEEAQLYADFGSGVQELGPGTSGTLVPCGSSAWFARDPQSKSDPAQLIRVDADGATPVYDSPGRGNAFLAEPRCGGRDITVTALSAAGDEQVSARVR